MKIKELHLVNFMNISEANFVFDDNMNFIYGQPASGKSALFDAMRITLSTYKRSSTYGEYVKQGEDNALITLKADIFGKIAVFTTTINRVKGNACKRHLEYDGESFEDSQVEEWLKSRNIDYHAKLAFAMQNEVNIVEIGSAERLTYIQKLFKFDFKAKKDKLMASKKEVEDKINELNSQIAGNRSTIEHLSIEQKTEERKLSDEVKKQYEAQIAEQTKLIRANQSIIDKANAIKDEINSYSKEVLNYSNLIMQEESIIASETEKENEIKTLVNEIADLEKIINASSAELESLKKDVDNWAVQKTEIIENLTEHNTHKIEIEADIKNVKAKLNLVSQGKCPTCGQPTTDLDNTLDEQLEKLMNELDREILEIDRLSLQKKEIENSFNLAQTKYNTRNLDLAGSNSNLTSKRNRLNSLKDRASPKHVCDISDAMTKKQSLLDLQNVKQKELEQYKAIKSVSELLDEIEPLKKAIDEDNIIIEKNTVIISRDEIRFEYVSENEDYFAKEKLVFSEFCKRANWALRAGMDVVVDATFLNAASRAKFLRRIDKKIDYELWAVAMDVPIDICLDRNANRTGRRFVPEETIRSMRNRYHFPEFNEGFDYIFIFRNNQLISRCKEDFI